MEALTSIDSVKVAIRIRPSFDASAPCISQYQGSNQVVDKDGNMTQFDYVYNQNCSQDQVYEPVKTLVEASLEGYNSSILTYGQTSSGKTYTIYGDHTEQGKGIVPRVADDLFNMITAKENENPLIMYRVSVQFLEIYGDEINDLLSSDHRNVKIIIRETSKGEVIVSGAKEEMVCSAEQVFRALITGSNKRHTSSTKLNQTSSRSHAIFTIIMKKYTYHNTPCGGDHDNSISDSLQADVLTSKFQFADLAGSERLKRTQSIGKQAQEGIEINKGLLALGNVISSLGDEHSKKGKVHVPYRDSKLTRILQESLGGNSKTLVVCCVSSTRDDYQETINALKYAQRVKNIKNAAVINRDPTLVFIDELKLLLSRVSTELLLRKLSNVDTGCGIASACTIEQLETLAVAFVHKEEENHNRHQSSNQQLEQIYQETSILPLPCLLSTHAQVIAIADSVYTKAAALASGEPINKGTIDTTAATLNRDDNIESTRMIDLQHTIDILKSDLKILTDSHVKSQKEKERLRDALQNKLEEIEQLELNTESMTRCVQSLQEEISGLKKSNAMLEQEKHTLLCSNDNLNNKLLHLQQVVQELKISLQTSNADLISVQTAMASTITALDSSKQEVISIKASMNMLDQQKATVFKSVESLHQHVETTTNTINTLTDKNIVLETTIIDKDQEVLSLRGSIDVLEQEKLSLVAKLETSHQELFSLKSSINTLAQKPPFSTSAQASEFESTDLDLLTLQSTTLILEQEKPDIQAPLEQEKTLSSSALESSNQELVALKASISQLEQEKTLSSSALESSNQELVALKASISQLEQGVSVLSLQEELAVLQKDRDFERDMFAQQVKALKDKLLRISSGISDMNKSSSSEISGLKDQLKKREEEVKSLYTVVAVEKTSDVEFITSELVQTKLQLAVEVEVRNVTQLELRKTEKLLCDNKLELATYKSIIEEKDGIIELMRSRIELRH